MTEKDLTTIINESNSPAELQAKLAQMIEQQIKETSKLVQNEQVGQKPPSLNGEALMGLAISVLPTLGLISPAIASSKIYNVAVKAVSHPEISKFIKEDLIPLAKDIKMPSITLFNKFKKVDEGKGE